MDTWRDVLVFHHEGHCLFLLGHFSPWRTQTCWLTKPFPTSWCSSEALLRDKTVGILASAAVDVSFALISAVCLWAFVQCLWRKVWCRREGSCWKMASESGIKASLGVIGLLVLFGESKTNSSAEFALAVLCFWRWRQSWEGRIRTWHPQAKPVLA